MQSRFTQEHIDAWRRDGAVLIPNFFTPAEVAAVQADYARVFDRAGAEAAMVKKKDGEIGKFNPAQFTSIQVLPLDCSPALNLIGVHPALIDFSRRAMACDEVQVYQCQAWAKFTGDADYDQPFHCDYVNHTLTGPSDVPRHNSVTFICLFSDVTEAHGPTHYVTRPDAEKIAQPEVTLTRQPGRQPLRLRHRHLAPRHQPHRARRPSLRDDHLLQGREEHLDRLHRLAVPPHQAVAQHHRERHARAARLLRRAEARRPLLDPAHPRPRPGPLSRLGPDALARGDAADVRGRRVASGPAPGPPVSSPGPASSARPRR